MGEDGGMPDIAPSPGGVRVARIVTAGTLDRPEGAVTLENNTWVIGDDSECLVIDAGHDGRAIVKSIPREQRVQGVLVSHGHFDHIDAVGEVCDGTRAPAHLHPATGSCGTSSIPSPPTRRWLTARS